MAVNHLVVGSNPTWGAGLIVQSAEHFAHKCGSWVIKIVKGANPNNISCNMYKSIAYFCIKIKKET